MTSILPHFSNLTGPTLGSARSVQHKTSKAGRRKAISDHNFQYHDEDGRNLEATKTSKKSNRPRPKSSIGHSSTPSVTSSYATEAHVQRIRSATSQADYKHYCRVTSAVGRHPHYSYTNEPIVWPSAIAEEEDLEDVESVDWTSPLDITAFLYKPEYIIFPKKDEGHEDAPSETSTGKETYISNATLPCDEDGPSKEGAENDGPESRCTTRGSDGSIKMEILANYVVSSSANRSQKSKIKNLFDRRVQDYSSFAKQLNREIRELSVETKRLETYVPQRKTWKQKSRDELIETGYKTLKNIYELNPDLTESAARKHVDGPPGTKWMGLSRVEVLEIMHRIRKELGVPQEKYKDDLQRLKSLHERMRPISASTSKRRKKGKGQNKKEGEDSDKRHKKCNIKSQAPKEKSAVKLPKLKISQLPTQHVPGPKHLHTNVCIRPWEPELDGWSMDDEEDDEELNAIACDRPTSSRATSARSSSDFADDNSQGTLKAPPSTPRRGPSNTSIGGERGTKSKSTKDDDADGGNVQDEDFITLEIFNPIYRSAR